MKMRGRAFMLAAMAVITADAAIAQNPVKLDLAGGDVTTPVATKTPFTVQVVNRLPKRTYSIQVTIGDQEIASLVIPGKQPGGQQPGVAEAGTDCQQKATALQTALEAEGTTTEADVRSKVAAAKITGSNCSEVETLIDNLTRSSPQTILGLQLGQEATVTVTRTKEGADEKDAKTWTFKFVTEARGTWLTHYGFSFLGNRDKAFFAAVQTDGTYKVTRKATRSNLQYQPTFTFSWVSAWNKKNRWLPAVTGGVGVDFTNPVVFIGLTEIVGDNLNAYVGIAGAKMQRLNGKYHEGNTIKDNLSEDQLNEKVYVPAVVFGVGFRFTTNPFSSGNKSGDQSGKGGKAGT
ncbi:MAG TPA: hypothetical protein VHQ90_00335 [Thermoanaerobaculia bacterium]|nr:hypothetical protein [Thermoanaerobaculia bacterium]